MIRGFDSRGNLASETVPRHLGGPLYSPTYDLDSRAKQVAYANGVTTVFGLDNERRWLDRVTRCGW